MRAKVRRRKKRQQELSCPHILTERRSQILLELRGCFQVGNAATAVVLRYIKSALHLHVCIGSDTAVAPISSLSLIGCFTKKFS